MYNSTIGTLQSVVVRPEPVQRSSPSGVPWNARNDQENSNGGICHRMTTERPNLKRKIYHHIVVIATMTASVLSNTIVYRVYVYVLLLR